MPEAAIVDVDGTLVDTNYHHALAWYRAFREHDSRAPGLAPAPARCSNARELVDAWTTKDDVEASKPEPDLVRAARCAVAVFDSLEALRERLRETPLVA